MPGGEADLVNRMKKEKTATRVSVAAVSCCWELEVKKVGEQLFISPLCYIN